MSFHYTANQGFFGPEKNTYVVKPRSMKSAYHKSFWIQLKNAYLQVHTSEGHISQSLAVTQMRVGEFATVPCIQVWLARLFTISKYINVFWNNLKNPIYPGLMIFFKYFESCNNKFHNRTNIRPYTEEYKIRANSNECPAKGKCIGTGLAKKIYLEDYYWKAKALLFIHRRCAIITRSWL